jgi:catechol 2,3-dioxygenase-like lactoylglutathione lyase family enzyme
MKFVCPLIAVSNVEISKKFYETVLNQKVTLDIGKNVIFEEKFAIQQGFAGLVGLNESEVKNKSNNSEFYFEEEDFNRFLDRLSGLQNIEYVHAVKEYSWGQKVIRFYDPDKHIIEVGESMESVIKRFFSQGLSVEEVALKTKYPEDIIKQFI